ncbi:ABC transporter permease [Acidisoma silvae]|uniref:ABC transporter permease n=1 Tax=Acidisoma silvae TaxID=2802396 RepID=A0A963YVQ1_9PROT|nr:ABC transporter permease [Acidisoma silvae]MCB8877766.1 ABC transporter permease [Acidisoma silvae]
MSVVETTKEIAGTEARASARSSFLKKRLGRFAPLLVLGALCLLLGLLNPSFFSLRNLIWGVANQAAIPLILSMGATFIIIMGSIDLSIEGVLCVGAMIVALLCTNDANSHHFGWWGPLLALLACTALGLLNGLVHVGLRIPSFMATLGLWFVGLGIGTVILGGTAVRVLDPHIRGIAFTRILDVPMAVWIAIAAFLLALLIERCTRFGRYVFAIGGGEDIAKLSGVPVARTRILAFTLAGFFTGIASLLASAQLGQANTTIADGRLFMTITAVVVGGTALTGGYGSVVNSLVGTLTVVVLANGMVLLGISPYVHETVQGLMIIAAVALSVRRGAQLVIK